MGNCWVYSERTCLFSSSRSRHLEAHLEPHENDQHQVGRQNSYLFVCKIQLVIRMPCKGHLAIQAWNLFLLARDANIFDMAAISSFENARKVPAPSCTTICSTPVPWWRSTPGWSSSSRMGKPAPFPRTSSSSSRASSTSS